MSHLPLDLHAAFEKFDKPSQTFREHEVAGEIEKSIQAAPRTDGPLKPEILAEWIAFEFFPDYSQKGNHWGTYYGPVLVGEVDGVIHERPSLTAVTDQTLEYWAQRSEEVQTPLLRNRYADLVWDFSKKITGKGADIKFARVVIDSAIEIADRALANHPHDCQIKLARALSVALSINDPGRILASARALMRLEKVSAELNKLGSWGFSFELLIENRKVPLAVSERDQIIADLEITLAAAIARESESAVPADPYAAEKASMLLARYYERTQRLDDRRRVMSGFAEMSIAFAKKTSAIVAVNWLRKVFELLTRYGMNYEAQSVAVVLQQIGPTVKSGMTTFSDEMVITEEEVKEYQEKLLSGSEDEALNRLVSSFIPRQAAIAEELKEWSESAPLSFHIPRGILDEQGRTIATIGTVDEDVDGREVQLVSQKLQLEWPFLHFALQGWIEKFKITPERLVERIMLCPAFPPERRHIIQRGLEAYFQDDHSTAAHLFIPQIENAIRNILVTSGRSSYKLGRHGGLNLKVLEDCLIDSGIRQILGVDVVRYLRILLTDPRGYNLRNNYCHGLIHVPQKQSVHTDRLIHVLLILSVLRLVDRAGSASVSEKHETNG